MAETIKRQYGTFDILPKDVIYWQKIEKVLRDCASKYGFEEIRFPTFEATELFNRGVGDTTDIVQKEMYTFNDREKRSLSLRPEGTACVVRSIIENGLVHEAMPLKLYYIANFFRHEKPQKGRSREFFQFGTELYGADGPIADATVILLAAEVFRKLGVKGVRLHLNSVGCDNCRDDYTKALTDFFESKKESLCPTCKQRLETNPRRILDCKDEGCKKICADAPKTVDYLCDDCKDHFDKLRMLLEESGVDYVVDVKIVRGLDYYNKTVFEFIDESIGAQSTVCGGGRYNKLVGQLGGPELAAVGFGMGITRLIEAMRQSDSLVAERKVPKIYLAPLGDDAKMKCAVLCEALRREGVYAECDMTGRSLKAQMKYSDKLGAEYTLILGDDEIKNGAARLRKMDGGDTVDVELSAEKIIEVING